jgi:hypothetical protein
LKEWSEGEYILTSLTSYEDELNVTGGVEDGSYANEI